MIKKGIILLAAAFMLLPTISKADEGMWMVHLFENSIYPQMKKMGLKLKGNEIYNENVADALSNAIVSLDFGCTGSMISKQGLLITNHHCAYGDIFKLSTKEHNYLEEGFWAMTRDEEKHIVGKNALFLRKVIDVTSEVNEMKSEYLNYKGKPMMRRIYGMIEKRYKNEYPEYDASCYSMWNGEYYFIYLYQVYTDVRLVGAPPVSIGAFGGETDNWGWPQHKGDFAIYRVYGDADGNPAEYSENNVPLVPRRTLTISAKPKKLGDYAMVLGYPGRTHRYSSSFEVDKKMNITNPIAVKARRAKLDVWDKHMNANPDLRLIYSDAYFGISNYTDYAKWENRCFKRYDVKSIREREEELLKTYAGKDSEISKNNIQLLDNLKRSFMLNSEGDRNKAWFAETYRQPCHWITSLYQFLSIPRDMERLKIDTISMNNKLLRDRFNLLKDEFKKFDSETDRELFGVMCDLFVKNIDRRYMSDTMRSWIELCDNNGVKLAEYIYDRSAFKTIEGIEEYFKTPRTIEDFNNDAVVKYNKAIDIHSFNDEYDRIADSLGYDYGSLVYDYYKAVYDMRRELGKVQYPNANSSMRITYGSVCDINPSDGIHYDYQTTINGYLEKEDKDDYEFLVNDKLKQLIKSKDWGRWGEKGNLYVDFLTNNDITGGNSGSPVLNGRGELIGLAFDGNRESMSGDVYYHPEYFKTVCVDIRFVLWVIDKYAGAQNILDELDIKF